MIKASQITPQGSPSVAKRVIRAVLAEDGIECRLTARTVVFSDLARASCVFVTIHGWQPSADAADQIAGLAIRHGFRVEFA